MSQHRTSGGVWFGGFSSALAGVKRIGPLARATIGAWAVIACMAVTARGADADAGLRVGAATEVITPNADTPMSGFNSNRTVKGVDDDLFAKAIVVERDGARIAMVVCDLITMPRSVVDEARRLIADKPGIAADHVMISATHTHTGPLLQAKPGQDAKEADRVHAYVKGLPDHIAAAVRKAEAKLAPARAMAGIGHEPRLSFNRRYFMKDGTLGWNPGKLNPNTDRPAGPIDPDVSVMLFESADKARTPIATHVNFAMHPDTRHGEQISADYPGQLADILAKVKGPDMVTVFATGACGDVNHVNVNFRGGQISPRESARIGMVLAGEVLKAYGRLQAVDAGSIRVRDEVISLPLPTYTSEDLERARETLKKPPASERVSMEHVLAYKVLDVASRQGKPIDAEVQVFALGDDIAFVGLPGEMFAELGMDIKKRSPFRQTILVTLANGVIGYVPTKHAFAEGSYEPFASKIAPGGGEQIVDTAVKLLHALK